MNSDCNHQALIGAADVCTCTCGHKFHVFVSASPLYTYKAPGATHVTVAVPLDAENGIIGDGIVLDTEIG